MAENSLKSTAVVKFDPFKLPDQFNKVAPQTDLHKIPEDWLLDEKDYSLDTLGSTSNPVIPRPTAAASQPLSLVSAPGGSFNMAYNNVDMVGDVDVIAHSDVVKKLIRLPFGKLRCFRFTKELFTGLKMMEEGLGTADMCFSCLCCLDLRRLSCVVQNRTRV